MRKKFPGNNNLATLAGIVSVLLWSSSIAFSKSVMTDIGTVETAFLTFFCSGILILLFFLIFSRPFFLNSIRAVSFKYYYSIAIFFVLNNVFLYVAVGLTKNNEELVIVSMLNYLWPVLIYLFQIYILKERVKSSLFFVGILLAFSGIVITLLQGYNTVGVLKLITARENNLWAYLFALLTAISWALYSCFTSREKLSNDIVAIPFIFLLSSLFFLGLLLFGPTPINLAIKTLYKTPDLPFLIIGPTALAYLGWYFAMKWGNKRLVVSLSFFIPLLSLIITHFKFNVAIKNIFWLAVVLLIAGSLLCYKSFKKYYIGLNNHSSHIIKIN